MKLIVIVRGKNLSCIWLAARINKWHSPDPLASRLQGSRAPPRTEMWKPHAWSVEAQTLEKRQDFRDTRWAAPVRERTNNGSLRIWTAAVISWRRWRQVCMWGDWEAFCPNHHHEKGGEISPRWFCVVLAPRVHAWARHLNIQVYRRLHAGAPESGGAVRRTNLGRLIHFMLTVCLWVCCARSEPSGFLWSNSLSEGDTSGSTHAWCPDMMDTEHKILQTNQQWPYNGWFYLCVLVR